MNKSICRVVSLASFTLLAVVASPPATQKFLAGEIARRGKVVRDNNIRAD